MISLGQLAAVTRSSKKTLRRSLAAAGVRAIVIGSGHGRNCSIRFYVDDVQEFLKSRMEPARIA
jgi:hypothetical protein